MHKSKIIQILKKFSKSEFKQLEKFVRSPIHNRHKDVIALVTYLKKNLHGAPEKLNQEVVFRVLFGKIPFDAQKLHYVKNYLLNTVEEFLAWHEWSSNNLHQQTHLIKAYQRLGLERHTEKAIKDTIQLQAKSPIKDADFYWRQYRLKFELTNYQSTKARNADLDLQELSQLLDISFISEKLKSACGMISHQAHREEAYDFGLQKEIVAFAKERDLIRIPAIGVYYYLFNILSTIENLEDFYKLKAMVAAHRDTFEKSELKNIYLLQINFCIRRWNTGDTDIMEELYQTYRAGLESKVFLENGILSPYTYNNAIIAGLRQQKMDWVKKIIHKYAPFLPADKREANFSFNLAKFYFETDHHDEAMNLLTKMDYSDELHILAGRAMLAKIYYKRDEIASLESLINSTQAYISRKKKMGYHKSVYARFFRLFKKLTKINIYDKVAIHKLKEQISQSNKMPEKDWLLQECEALLN